MSMLRNRAEVLLRTRYPCPQLSQSVPERVRMIFCKCHLLLLDFRFGYRTGQPFHPRKTSRRRSSWKAASGVPLHFGDVRARYPTGCLTLAFVSTMKCDGEIAVWFLPDTVRVLPRQFTSSRESSKVSRNDRGGGEFFCSTLSLLALIMCHFLNSYRLFRKSPSSFSPGLAFPPSNPPGIPCRNT